MNNFTTDDLILYLHNQLPAPLMVAIQLKLLSDWALREKLSVLRQSESLFKEAKLYKPRTRALQSVMQYVRKKEKV